MSYLEISENTERGNKLNVFEYMPLTLTISSNSDEFLYDIEKFKIIFNILEKHSNNKECSLPTIYDIKKINSSLSKSKHLQTKVKTSTKYHIHKSHFTGHNLWILKVNQLNRGRGIYVIKDLQLLYMLISQMIDIKIKDKYMERNVQDDLQYLFHQLHKDASTNQQEYSNISTLVDEGVKTSTFVIQKYIEDPMLIEGRKFDIRIWVLITQEKEVYVFKEGYIRTSSEEFSLDESDIDKLFIHLTNNAVQKNNTEYGKFEDGNQLSFQFLQKYLKAKDIDFYSDCLSRIYEMIKMTTDIILNPTDEAIVNPAQSENFELFGYDFMLDNSNSCNPWIIEINTNPCLEESSDLLKRLIPRMINDMLKLTIDKIFCRKVKISQEETFSVPSYPDDQNLWVLLSNPN